VRTSTARPGPLIILLLLSLLPAWATAKQSAYDGIVFFGDSLSDPGNKFALTGLKNTPPYDLLDAFLIPDGPYAKGGLHHSNGKTWAEQFAKAVGLGGYAGPAYRNRGKAANYAYGGARAGTPVVLAPCTEPTSNQNLRDQVAMFLNDVNNTANADALFALFIGGNDVADAVRVLACDSSGATSGFIIADALTSVSENISALYDAGARTFLIGNAPDMGLIPAFNPPLNPILEASAAGTCFSLLYNLGTLSNSFVAAQCGFPMGIPGLVDVLGLLQGSLPGVEFIQYDVFSKIRQLVLAPMPGEPQNGVDACVMPGIPPFSCRNPDNFVFWDGVHPTKAVHSILADEVAVLIGP